MKEVKEGLNAIGVIESKEEAVKKDWVEYWKYKITLKGETNSQTFSQWNYEEGKEIHVGDIYMLFWTEKEGTGAHGPITYRNINSIGPVEKYGKDPELAKKTDAQLADEAPKSTMKEVIQEKENPKGVEGSPSSYLEREERKQLLIVRQSSLNYATQLAGIFLAWKVEKEKQQGKSFEQSLPSLEEISKRIKEIAKEYEEQILRK